MITLNITNNWELIDVDNGIGGRLNVMWLSPDGVGISTRDYSHMTILNMILEKSDVTDFWDIDYVKEHKLQDPDDKRRIFPDDNIKKLFHLREGDELHFNNFQTYMKRLYDRSFPEDSAADESDASEPEEIKKTETTDKKKKKKTTKNAAKTI